MLNLRLLILFLFLSLWFILTTFNIVKPIFLPPIPEVVASLILLFANGYKDILFSLYRTIIAFLIGTTIAIPVGLLFGSFKQLYDSFQWFIDFFRSVPVTAMFPLFLVFFGFGDSSKIAMAAWASGFIIMINTIHGVWSVKPNRKLMARTKRATPYQILTKITFPEALPFIFAGMRIGLSWNLIVTIVAEMFIGTRYGLGHRIYDASVVFDTSGVISGIILIGLIGLLINNIMLKIEQKIVHWKS